MRVVCWTITIVTCLVTGRFAPLEAQEAGNPPVRSSRSGVYTAKQATRGQDAFANFCLGCHTVASHTGQAFVTTWGGRTLYEMFSYISEQMPRNEPGSLSQEEYTQIVAYLLKLNGMPAGQQELRSDSMVLKAIRFDPVQPEKRP